MVQEQRVKTDGDQVREQKVQTRERVRDINNSRELSATRRVGVQDHGVRITGLREHLRESRREKEVTVETGVSRHQETNRRDQCQHHRHSSVRHRQ